MGSESWAGFLWTAVVGFSLSLTVFSFSEEQCFCGRKSQTVTASVLCFRHQRVFP